MADDDDLFGEPMSTYRDQEAIDDAFSVAVPVAVAVPIESVNRDHSRRL